MDGEPANCSVGDELPFDQLLQALRRRDEAAWARVFAEFLPRVKAAIRQQFGAVVARTENAGGEAVASACGTIFRRITAGQFVLNTWDDLAGLFIRIALNKCLDKVAKRARLVNWSDLPAPAPGASDGMPEPSAAELSPPDEAVRAEACREFQRAVDLVRRRLKRVDPRYAEVFKLRLEGGHSTAEVARMAGCSERKASRAWQYARDLLRGLLDESPADESGD